MHNVLSILTQLKDEHKESLINLLSIGGKSSVAVEGDYFILIVGENIPDGVHVITDNVRDDLIKMKLVRMDDKALSIKLTKLGWSVVNIIVMEKELCGE